MTKEYSHLARPQRMVDAMMRYVRLYGLRPIGRHRHLAYTLLGNNTKPCEMCAGTGLVPSDEKLSNCPVCNGYGVAYTITPGELDAWRKVVLCAYPDAGVPDWQPCIPFEQNSL